ncbi:hypothetical protein F511_09332 [Dorcoceras hygrometricum]|uniref:Uncharacterized protein n=1 Tax=Dorcoceras hygrometricum TaxID=472368 RepID=A0A2Z7C2K5_9LAMI|nr:hypothetical protein F511_09332 [Dorcoceras hygrometricum]
MILIDYYYYMLKLKKGTSDVTSPNSRAMTQDKGTSTQDTATINRSNSPIHILHNLLIHR